MCFIVSWFINVNLLAISIICVVSVVGVVCILFVIWFVALCFDVGALWVVLSSMWILIGLSWCAGCVWSLCVLCVVMFRFLFLVVGCLFGGARPVLWADSVVDSSTRVVV